VCGVRLQVLLQQWRLLLPSVLLASDPLLQASDLPCLNPLVGRRGVFSRDLPLLLDAFHGNSFHDVVKRNLNPSSSLVHEAPTPTISLRKDVISKLARLSSMTLICHFNGLWPHLVDLHDWILRSWLPVLKGDVFIHPCAQGFFIFEFDLQEDRDLIFSSAPGSGVVLVYV
jgi:hypothetical protein